MGSILGASAGRLRSLLERGCRVSGVAWAGNHSRLGPVINHLCPSPISRLYCILYPHTCFCLSMLLPPNVYTLTIGCVLHSAQACSRRPFPSLPEQSIGRGDGAGGGGGGGEREWSPQAWGHPVVTLGSFVTSGFPLELVSTPFFRQASTRQRVVLASPVTAGNKLLLLLLLLLQSWS